MSAIITITFNPALDKSTSIKELIPERKLKCSEPVYEPGGGGINVARAIKKLGGTAKAFYLAGGDAGKIITKLLTREGIESVVTETTDMTRENLVILDTSSNRQYLFVMTGPQITENEWKACLNNIETVQDVGFIVASGSLPNGVPVDIFVKLAAIAKNKNAKLIIDSSGEPLMQAVKAGVYLIKPNLRELGLLAGEEELKEERAIDAAWSIIDNGNCEVIVVSMGAGGALLITQDRSMKITPPTVNIKSTVGAGDSLLAGLVLSLAENKSLTDAIKYGVACGTAATMSSGTELCTLENALYLYNIIKADTSCEWIFRQTDVTG